MNADNIIKSLNAVKSDKPLIHCITNPISINQCANAVLALGARPMMAEHPREVSEITSSAGALLLNLGNITDVRMESMLISARTAGDNGIPFVLDTVGTACSRLRRSYALELIEKYPPAVIKGNYSELAALYDSAYKASGVDSAGDITEKEMSHIAVRLAEKYKTVILASSKTDIAACESRVILIKNGTPQLSRVTGTGCMLGALCACFLAVSPALNAAVSACAVMGICGELAMTDKGTGSFAVSLMDKLSAVKADDIEKYLKTEEISIEKA